MKKEKVLTQKDVLNIIENLKTEKYSVKDIENLFRFLQNSIQRHLEDIIHFSFENFSKDEFIEKHPEYKKVLIDESFWMNIYSLRNRKMELNFFANYSMDEENKSLISYLEKLAIDVKKNRIPYGISK